MIFIKKFDIGSKNVETNVLPVKTLKQDFNFDRRAIGLHNDEDRSPAVEKSFLCFYRTCFDRLLIQFQTHF